MRTYVRIHMAVYPHTVHCTQFTSLTSEDQEQGLTTEENSSRQGQHCGSIVCLFVCLLLFFVVGFFVVVVFFVCFFLGGSFEIGFEEVQLGLPSERKEEVIPCTSQTS